MDSAIIEWLGQVLNRSFIEGRSVLEVGSRNINGSPREVIEPMKPREYVGIDIEDGPGVDVVMDAIDLANLPRRFDLVVSCEALEHMQDWQGCFLAMASVAHTLIVTTRSVPFGAHCMPHDYWRFSQETMVQMARAANLSVLDCVKDWEYPGVFLRAVNPKPRYSAEEHEAALYELNHLPNPPTPVMEG